MKKFRIFLIIANQALLLLGLLLIVGEVRGQSTAGVLVHSMGIKYWVYPTPIPINQPVHGYLAFDAESKLLLLNTFTGDISTLVELVYPRPIGHPHWDLQGDRIVYNDTLDTKSIAPFDLPISSALMLPYNGVGVFAPQDWSPDGQSILGIFSGTDLDYYEIQIVNTTNPVLIVVRHDQKETLLNENNQLKFYRTVGADWNPVYSEWMVVELSTYPVGTEEDIERPFVTVVLVMNYITGETHLLNDVMSEEIDSLPAFAWSPDGRRLIVRTGEFGDFTQMVSVLDTNGNWQFTAATNVPLPQISTTVLGWLGINDLFMLIQFERDTTVQTYTIAQNIQGTLHTSPFFSLDIAPLITGPVPIIGAGSWHLAAKDDERRELSCLFDQALPARLVVGSPARVVSPTLDIWAEPKFEGTPVAQLPTGTEITVIGSPACFNAENYYRLWPVQLADGTVGWAAEANLTTYFLELPSANQPPIANTGTYAPVTDGNGREVVTLANRNPK